MGKEGSSGMIVLKKILELREKAFNREKKYPTKLYVSKVDESSLLTLRADEVGSSLVGQILKNGVQATLPTIYGMSVTYEADRTEVQY